ncbi:MAG TPA: hypothetical protein DDX99_02645 [Desulfofustis sp.]|jgi:hypothetical protein|nr:hypothetical protein [Desulfofustis sp. PB-SRB1]HBH27731.1 hypothetical protein [Desulfofustis sp.]
MSSELKGIAGPISWASMSGKVKKKKGGSLTQAHYGLRGRDMGLRVIGGRTIGGLRRLQPVVVIVAPFGVFVF